MSTEPAGQRSLQETGSEVAGASSGGERRVGSRARSSAILDRTSRTAGTLLPPLVVVVILLIVWEFGVKTLNIKQYILPPPTKIWHYLIDSQQLLWKASLVTGQEIVIGFAISVALGIPLGILVARSRLFSLTMYPLIVASQTFPKLAIGPLLIVWFGFGQLPKLLLAVLVAFFRS